MMKYTIIDRATGKRVDTDSPEEAYQEAFRIEEKGHDYAIKNNQLDQYVSRLSVYLAY